MTQTLFQLDDFDFDFPPVEYALSQPNGLLAVGGDLSVKRLLKAYQNGIFPWFNEGDPILWWSPDPRGILELEELHLSNSFKKHLRKTPYKFSINLAFDQVIKECALQRLNLEGTWIIDEMQDAYRTMHQHRYAHSIEVWLEGQLVGGLYGVAVSNIFCGESMFHKRSNASKAAMWALVTHLKKHRFDFIDCQLLNPHLASLGAKEISRERFLNRLNNADNSSANEIWNPMHLELKYG